MSLFKSIFKQKRIGASRTASLEMFLRSIGRIGLLYSCSTAALSRAIPVACIALREGHRDTVLGSGVSADSGVSVSS